MHTLLAATIVSLQVGLPTTRGNPNDTAPMTRPWHSGFVKEPVAGRVPLSHVQLTGDGQADLENHGGLDKAVLAYAASRYPQWRAELPDVPWVHGGFGENLTIADLDETTVCIGDRFNVGPTGATPTAVLEVSQPRQPCWKFARRWGLKNLPARGIANGALGWYFRVLTPGSLAADDTMTLTTRPYPQWPIARLNQVWYVDKHDRSAAAELAANPYLAEEWRLPLRERSAKSAE